MKTLDLSPLSMLALASNCDRMTQQECFDTDPTLGTSAASRLHKLGRDLRASAVPVYEELQTTVRDFSAKWVEEHKPAEGASPAELAKIQDEGNKALQAATEGIKSSLEMGDDKFELLKAAFIKWGWKHCKLVMTDAEGKSSDFDAPLQVDEIAVAFGIE